MRMGALDGPRLVGKVRVPGGAESVRGGDVGLGSWRRWTKDGG